jgi:hypothetical protein
MDPMAERSPPTVLALDETSCTFPDTTARTETIEEVPTASAGTAVPSGPEAAFPSGSDPDRSTTQTPPA